MRVAVTLIELTPGAGDWVVALGPSGDPHDHRQFIKDLPAGKQRAQVLASGRGHEKRRKVSYSPAPAKPAKKKAK